MADVKIRFTTNGQKTAEEIAQIGDSATLTTKKLTALSNDLLKTREAQLGGDKSSKTASIQKQTQEQLVNAALRLVETLKLQKGELQGLEAGYKALNNVIKDQTTYGFDPEFVSILQSVNTELKERIDLLKDEISLQQQWVSAKKSRADELALLEKEKVAKQELIEKERELQAKKEESLELIRIERKVKEDEETLRYMNFARDQIEKQNEALARRNELESKNAALEKQRQAERDRDKEIRDAEELVRQEEELATLMAKGRENAAKERKEREQALQHFEEYGRKLKEINEQKKEEAEIARLTAEAEAELRAEKEKALILAEQKKKEDEAAEIKLQHDMMVALGDKVGLLNEQYKIYEVQLRKSIQDTGVSSDETKKLAFEMNKLQAEMRKADKVQWSTKIKNLLTSFVSAQAILWGVRTALRTVTSTITESMRAAADAEETWNLFITTFEDAQATALSTASSLSSSLGLASSTAQKALGIFGDLAAGYGATDAAALQFAETAARTAMDIVSYKNVTGDMETIFSTFSSGLAGNVENFRKLGYVITQAEVKNKLYQKGLDKLTGSALQYAQIQARLELLIEKSSKAQGDMEKTMESTQNTTRRLNEATKEWKETLGEDWNKIFTPIKSWLADILEDFNKIKKASELVASGVVDINVFNLDDAEDWETFADNMDIAFSEFKRSLEQGGNGLERLKDAFKEFNPTAEQTEKVISELGWEELAEDIRLVFKEFEDEKAEVIALENRKAALEDLRSAALSYIDAVNMLSNVSMKSTVPEIKGYHTESGYSDLVGGLFNSNNNESSISKYLKAFKGTDASEFGDVFDNFLGIATMEENFKAKLDVIKKLYEETYNYFKTNGTKDELGIISSKEQNALDDILNLYHSVSKELEGITAEMEKQKEIAAAIETNIKNWNSAAENYRGKAAESRREQDIRNAYAGSPENIIDNRIEWGNALASLGSIESATTEEEKKAYLDAVASIKEFYETQERLLKEENKTQGENAIAEVMKEIANIGGTPFVPNFSSDPTIQAEGEAMYLELTDTIDDLRTTLESLGFLNADELNEIINNATNTGAENIANAIKEMETNAKNEANRQAYQSAGDTLLGGLGEIGNFVSALNDGLSIMAAFTTSFASLITQTEAFTNIASMLTDNVLPVLNAFLEPLLPVIQAIGNTIGFIVETVLIPLFPILKLVAKGFTIIAGTLKLAFGIISDAMKIVVGSIITGVTELINGVISLINLIPFVNIKKIDNQWAKDWMHTDLVGNAENTWNEMNEHLASIDAMTMDIEKNTEKDDKSEQLSLLNDLFSKGLLTDSAYVGQLAALTGKSYGDLTLLGEGVSYQQTPKGSYIATQNITFSINGTNLSPEQLKRVINEVIEEQKSPGNHTWVSGAVRSA